MKIAAGEDKGAGDPQMPCRLLVLTNAHWTEAQYSSSQLCTVPNIYLVQARPLLNVGTPSHSTGLPLQT